MDNKALELFLKLAHRFSIELNQEGKETSLTAKGIQWAEMVAIIYRMNSAPAAEWFEGEWLVGIGLDDVVLSKEGELEPDQGWMGEDVRTPEFMVYYNRVVFPTFHEALEAIKNWAGKSGWTITSELPKQSVN